MALNCDCHDDVSADCCANLMSRLNSLIEVIGQAVMSTMNIYRTKAEMHPLLTLHCRGKRLDIVLCVPIVVDHEGVTLKTSCGEVLVLPYAESMVELSTSPDTFFD